MPEDAGQLMKRVKQETSNLDSFAEDEVVNVFLQADAETLTLGHNTPTATARGPVYYASDGSIGDDVRLDVGGNHIFAGFFKAS